MLCKMCKMYKTANLTQQILNAEKYKHETRALNYTFEVGSWHI